MVEVYRKNKQRVSKTASSRHRQPYCGYVESILSLSAHSCESDTDRTRLVDEIDGDSSIEPDRGKQGVATV